MITEDDDTGPASGACVPRSTTLPPHRRQHPADMLGRKRDEAPVPTMRMAGRRRSARDVQVLAGVEGRQPGDRRAVLPLRAPQLVELLEVEPELARSPEEAPQAQRRVAGDRAPAASALRQAYRTVSAPHRHAATRAIFAVLCR